jgi:hypothetical protein
MRQAHLIPKPDAMVIGAPVIQDLSENRQIVWIDSLVVQI